MSKQTTLQVHYIGEHTGNSRAMLATLRKACGDVEDLWTEFAHYRPEITQYSARQAMRRQAMQATDNLFNLIEATMRTMPPIIGFEEPRRQS